MNDMKGDKAEKAFEKSFSQIVDVEFEKELGPEMAAKFKAAAHFFFFEGALFGGEYITERLLNIADKKEKING